MTEMYYHLNKNTVKTNFERQYVQKFDESSVDYPYLALMQAEDLTNVFSWLADLYRSQVKTYKKLVDGAEAVSHNPRFTQYSIEGEPGRRFVDVKALRHFRPDLFEKYGSVNTAFAAACLSNDTLVAVLRSAGISDEEIYNHYDVSLTSVESKMTDAQKEECIKTPEPKRVYFWDFASDEEDSYNEDSYNGELEE